MTQDQVVNRWLKGSDEAWDTAETLLKAKRFNHSLFFAQLYLEKLIKALHFQLRSDYPLPVHNLVQLLKNLDIKITKNQELDLRTITRFNITARYYEERMEIYRMADGKYANLWLEKAGKLGKFIKSFFKK